MLYKSSSELWHNVKWFNTCVIEVPEIDNKREKLFEEIKAKISPKMVEINLHIQVLGTQAG